jgi:hypothetical protein
MADPTSQIAAHDAAAQALEDAAVSAATTALSTALQGVNRWLVGAWGRAVGKPSAKAQDAILRDLLDELAFRITGIALDPADSLLSHAQRARLLGHDQGFAEISQRPVRLDEELLPSTRAAIEHGVATAREALDDAAQAVRELPDGDLRAVEQRVAATARATQVLERTARTTFNAELNEGLAAVAVHAGARLVWVAERDACVTCLALSGHVVNPGQPFDWRLTFGAKAYPVKEYNNAGDLVEIDLERPPRHPNCRCRVSPWLGHDTEGAESVTHDWADAIKDAEAAGDQVAADAARRAAAAAKESAAFDFPAALRREAERSILLGHALPSESENVRAQAADRLLARIGTAKNSRSPSGWQVPASVKKRTERALKNGTFTTGSVPTTRK